MKARFISWRDPIAATALVAVMSGIAIADNTDAGIAAATLYPYEQGYANASYVAIAEVVLFDVTQGVQIRMTDVLRGRKLKQDSLNYVSGTRDFPFLNSPGAVLTVFLAELQDDTVTLYHGPTEGGLIWQDHETVGFIASAFSDPDASLQAAQPRERLAAAYYRALKGSVSDTQKDRIVDAAVWGLVQEDNSINQAAVRALAFLDINVNAVAGPYRPGSELAVKQESGQRLQTWWEQQKSAAR